MTSKMFYCVDHYNVIYNTLCGKCIVTPYFLRSLQSAFRKHNIIKYYITLLYEIRQSQKVNPSFLIFTNKFEYFLAKLYWIMITTFDIQ